MVAARRIASDGRSSSEASGPATEAPARIRPRTGRPRSSAVCAVVRTSAAAPSESCEAFPAVIVPSGVNAGRRAARPSSSVAGHTPSSAVTAAVPLGTSTGTMLDVAAGSSPAAAARRWDRAAQAS